MTPHRLTDCSLGPEIVADRTSADFVPGYVGQCHFVLPSQSIVGDCTGRQVAFEIFVAMLLAF